MNYRYIIDRIEGDYVIVEKENGDMFRINAEAIKGNFKEGDILVEENQFFKVDEKLTQHRNEEIYKKTEGMWQ